jgi:hypothetical protein
MCPSGLSLTLTRQQWKDTARLGRAARKPGFEAGDLPCGQLQGSQLAVTVLVARGGAAALLREAEPVRDSLLQAAREPVSDTVMLVVKQSARLLSRPKAKLP